MHARYWCQHGLVVTVDGPQGPRSVTLDKPFARIGAPRAAEIVLPDLRVAGRGLYLHATEAGVFGLGFSLTATTEKPWRGWLRPGQEIPFGPYRISARLAVPSPVAPPPDLPALDLKGSSLEPYPVIAVAFDGIEVARRRLSRQLSVVGRLRPSTLPIESSDLSASHVILYWHAGTLWAIDLLSRTGTFLAGSPVDCAELPLGCSLIAGEVQVSFVGLFSSRRSATADEGSSADSLLPLPEPPLASAEPVPPGVAAEASPSPPAMPGAPAPELAIEIANQRNLVEELRAELHDRERALREEQEQWLAQQKQYESEWRQRMGELAEKQAARTAEQQQRRAAMEEERRTIQAQFRERTAALVRMRANLERQQQEFQQQWEQWLAQQKQREAELEQRAEELSQRQALIEAEQQRQERALAERRAAEQQLQEQLARAEQLRRELEDLRKGWASVPPSVENRALAIAADPPPSGSAAALARVRPAQPVPPDEPQDWDEGDEGIVPIQRPPLDETYDEVLDRLMQVNRRRSSWWCRFQEVWRAMFAGLARRRRQQPTEPSPSAPKSSDQPA